MRFGLLALAGATTLSLAACSASNKANPVQQPTPASPSSSAAAAPTQAPTQAPPRAGNQRVAGLIASVSGDTIQVTQKSGTATVDFTPATKVSEVTAAGLPDVTAGSCVNIRPTRDNPQNGGTISAAAVRISPAVNGQCPQPPQPPAGAPKHPPVQGTVSSVAGNTITVNNTGGSTPQTTVTVSDKTRYTKEAVANSQAIAQGKCVTAEGTEGSGALQATTITLRPASDGKCPEPGARPHRHGG
jgi:hypothetical protein